MTELMRLCILVNSDHHLQAHMQQSHFHATLQASNNPIRIEYLQYRTLYKYFIIVSTHVNSFTFLRYLKDKIFWKTKFHCQVNFVYGMWKYKRRYLSTHTIKSL